MTTKEYPHPPSPAPTPKPRFDPARPAPILVSPAGEPVPLLGVVMEGRFQGCAGEVAVRQRFRNTEAKPIEVTYVFPLPDNASVCDLVIEQDGRVLRAQVEERDKAFELYDEALASGDGAFLLDQERPNVFQVSVGSLLPGSEVVVTIRFLMTATPTPRGLRLMIPTSISPRYSPPTLSAAERAEIDRTTPPYAGSVPYGLTLDLAFEAHAPIRVVESPSHPLRTELDGPRARVALGQGMTAPDRDLVIEIATAEPHRPGAVAVEAHGRDHLLLDLFPELPEGERTTPRSVAILVDCSGSMDGDSIDQARRAVELCLRALSEGDRFQIFRFGSRHQSLFPGFQTFSQATLDAAVDRVRQMRADLGGTEILGALAAVFDAVDEGHLDVIVLTDGEVSNEAEVLRLVAVRGGRCRIFPFGIGAGASEHLVAGLARQGHGVAEFIFPGERIEPKVLRQFGRIDSPCLENVTIDWGHRGVEAAPVAMPPVFDGDALTIAGRLPAGARFADDDRVVVRADGPTGPLEWSVAVRRGEGGAVPLWWARQAIRDHEEGRAPRRGSRQERGQPEEKAVQVAMLYGLLSSQTSFVAVEERAADRKAGEPCELRRVPVLVTAGYGGRGSIQAPAFLSSAIANVFSVQKSMPARALGWLSSEVCNFLDGSASMRKRSSPSPRRAPQPSGSPSEIQRKACESFPAGKPPARSGKTTASPPKESAGMPPFLDLLATQNAEGAFVAESVTRQVWALSKKRFLALAEALQIPGGENPLVVLATLLGLRWLEMLAADQEPVWRLAARKARAWLRKTQATGPDGEDLWAWLEREVGTPG
ncbi:MAG: VWA domain-containing protein [Candidatus Riflebacteria bacterium]|nr:VWA domain-containing protein [Candidatus Riflebacteria bacterium]